MQRPADTHNMRNRYYLAAIAALVTFFVYLPALKNEFLNLDDGLFMGNYRIRSLDWNLIKWAFTDIASNGFWYPVIWISHAVDYAFWGPDPRGYHLTNVILHALNTFLVVLIVIELLTTESVSRGTGAVDASKGNVPRTGSEDRAMLITALVTGVLFGLHPVNVESVAWVAARTELLFFLFFLMAVAAYIAYGAAEREVRNRGGRMRLMVNRPYMLAFAAFLLASACKPTTVILPAVLLLLDWYPLRRLRSRPALRRAVIEKIPFVAVSLLVAAETVYGSMQSGRLSSGGWSGAESLPVAAKALVASLGKVLLPLHLIPLYPYPKAASVFSFEYGGPLAAVVGITAACFGMKNRNRTWLVMWGFFVICLVPVIGIVKARPQYMADRYLYLPELAPLMLAGSGAALLWRKVDGLRRKRVGLKALLVVAFVCIAATMAYATTRQISVWRNSGTLWTCVIEQGPYRIPLAYNHRGLWFKEQDLVDRALKDYTAAISVDPSYVKAYYHRGLALLDQGKLREALADFNKAVALEPGFAEAFTGRGWIYAGIGRPDLAVEDYNRSLALAPDGFLAYNDRGLLYQSGGRVDEAIADFTSAINRNPLFVQAYINRALAYEQARRPDLAMQDYTAAIAADPSHADAYNNRGLLLERAGRLDEALADFNNALARDPAHADAYNNRGLVHEDMGHYDDAVSDYARAIALRPQDPLAYVNRGIAYGKMGNEELSFADFRKACDLGSEEGCRFLTKRRQP